MNTIRHLDTYFFLYAIFPCDHCRHIVSALRLKPFVHVYPLPESSSILLRSFPTPLHSRTSSLRDPGSHIVFHRIRISRFVSLSDVFCLIPRYRMMEYEYYEK